MRWIGAFALLILLITAHFELMSLPAAATAEERPAAKPTWIRVNPRRCNFLIYAEDGQSFSGDLSAASLTIDGAPGAVVSVDNKQPILHNGVVKVQCRKGNLVLSTRFAAVNLPNGSSAVVESAPNSGLVRVIARGDVSLRSRRRGAPVHLKSGEMAACTEEGIKQTPFDKEALAIESPAASSLLAETIVRRTAPIRMIAAGGTEFRPLEGNMLMLRKGETFVQAPEEVSFRCAGLDVTVKKNALADIELIDGTLRVKSLSGPGHVNVVCGHTLPVHPGQELIISTHQIGDSDLYPADGVGRRRVDHLKLEKTFNGAMCDFSIVSFLDAAEHMRTVKLGVYPDDKVCREKLLKTAAAVHTVSGSRDGAYRSTAKSRNRIPAPAPVKRPSA